MAMQPKMPVGDPPPVPFVGITVIEVGVRFVIVGNAKLPVPGVVSAVQTEV